MSLLETALETGKFGVTAEMAPPKGYDFSEQMEAAELLKEAVLGEEFPAFLTNGAYERHLG